MEKVWEIKDPEAYLRGKKRTAGTMRPPREERDPSSAYNRSMLVWGLGQLYNDQLIKGAMFMVMMLVVLGSTVLGVIYQNEVYRFLLSRGISRSAMFLAAETLVCCALLFWVHNAADAYHSAARYRRTPFSGVPSRITPFLCSLLVPGWGQYLNGQPVKGALCAGLAVIGVFSVLAAILTFRAWPLLDPADSRLIVEEIFAVCLLIAPVVPLLWTFSAYDALKVSRDEFLKEPLWERIKAAYYRGRTQGWVRGVFPQIKGTFLLVLFLTFFVVVVHNWFPTGFYARQLSSAHARLQNRGMIIMPELIGKLLAFLGK
jgi:hypothetical protein